MAFCQHCGQQIPDGANACPYCGTFVNNQNAQQDFQQNYQQAPQQDFQQGYQQAPQQDFQQGYQQAPQQGYQQVPQQDFQQGYQQGYAAPGQQPYITPEMDVQQSRGIAWLSYMGLLFLIPMFVRKYSDYTRFHVKQGATLCAFEIAYWITYGIIMAIVDAIFPGYHSYYLYPYTYYVHSNVYNVISFLLGLAGVFFLVVTIMGIVNAASGKRKELILFGKIPWIAKLLDNTIYKN